MNVHYTIYIFKRLQFTISKGYNLIIFEDYNFDDWKRWQEADGLLCRTNSDCGWIENSLQCERDDLPSNFNVNKLFY
jgi:hypothetical protein